MTTHTNDEEFRQDFRNHEIALSAPLEVLGQMLKERLEQTYQGMLKQVVERILAADPTQGYTDDELVAAIGEYANHGRLPIPTRAIVKTKRTAAEKRERHTRYMAKRRAKLKAAAEAAVARPSSKPPRRDRFPEAYLAYRTAKRAQARARA